MAITSSGGHVYDRTTGTWQGETQGSFGDGKDHGAKYDSATVIYDANGITGLRYDSPTTPAVGRTGDGGGSGPGAAAVATDGPSSAGGGPGAAIVIAGPVATKGLGQKLKAVMKTENTSFLSNGEPFVPSPYFSNAEEIEELMGDGDSPLEVAWYYKQYAALSHVGWDLGTKLGTKIGTFHNSMDNSWVSEDTPLFSPDYNWQQ